MKIQALVISFNLVLILLNKIWYEDSFFIDSFSAGGKERRLTELIKGLRLRSDIHFELVVMNKEIHFKDVLELGIRIHYVIRKTKKDLSVFRKIYQICKNYKPDFVHCWDSMSAVYVIPALKLLNIKFVNGLVVDAPERRNILNKSWLRAKLTFPFSNVIIGNSHAGLAAYNAPKFKSVCIYNGFNFSRTENITKNVLIREQLHVNTRFVIGMVASFSKYKDYETYFKAAHLLLKKRTDITFLAIGNDTDSICSRNLIDPSFIDHFRLLGKKSGVESYINSMDICVLCTFTEGISNSILEYMALEKPVIATFGGGTDELMQDQKTGYLISQANPEELTEKMEILLNDAPLRSKMGVAGKQRIQNYFSIDKMVNEYVLNYKKIRVRQS